MVKIPATGRASIFRGKENGVRVQAVLTKDGGQAFERKRVELTKLYRRVKKRKPKIVSDADVIEFLARGVEETTGYLEQIP